MIPSIKPGNIIKVRGNESFICLVLSIDVPAWSKALHNGAKFIRYLSSSGYLIGWVECEPDKNPHRIISDFSSRDRIKQLENFVNYLQKDNPDPLDVDTYVDKLLWTNWRKKR